ncbi:NADP-dependent 3-hydroxy acid dehydrogenase YdfG [Jatrophihabitans sp. GAS493]|uniref:SDR family oxidoreductase n=1 Tax=Jatrophihabitans sp. GAS493 TaxID=1907575 RepID=UPI000BB92BB0|nr:SDR family oxidoreductase [Jatrophihabitans sp. GAS493]SOD74281.1 NADP-dependent 3-hydroxy acid dehydrogenase YdfG [Jatrophihabitans sp. GAS493]
MQIADKVVVITGAGSGIGAELARRFAALGAEAVVVSDRDGDAAGAVAASINDTLPTGIVVSDRTDVSDPAQIQALVAATIDRFGRVDLFCSNAGITTGGGVEASLEEWQRTFDINVLAHVHAARSVVPTMLANGGGYLLNTASAAGLLTSPGDAPYAVTKHAAVAFAEWLAVTYGGQGIGVSVLCPLGVATPLLMDPLAENHPSAQTVAASGEIISTERVADAVVDGLEQEKFLILPHPEVASYWVQKATDPDRWLAGVRRLVGGGRS